MGSQQGQEEIGVVELGQVETPKLQGGMGFRDIRAFNQALLAKRACRYIETPDSLCARLLKAKYFPNGSLLDTVFTGHSSAIWKGILHGLDLVKRDLIWRIGTEPQSELGEVPGSPGAVTSDLLLLIGIVVSTEYRTFWTTMVLGLWNVLRNIFGRWILRRFSKYGLPT